MLYGCTHTLAHNFRFAYSMYVFPEKGKLWHGVWRDCKTCDNNQKRWLPCPYTALLVVLLAFTEPYVASLLCDGRVNGISSRLLKPFVWKYSNMLTLYREYLERKMVWPLTLSMQNLHSSTFFLFYSNKIHFNLPGSTNTGSFEYWLHCRYLNCL